MSKLGKVGIGILIAAGICAAAASPATAQAGTGFVAVFGGLTLIGGDVILPCTNVCIPEGSEVNIPEVKTDFDDDTPTFGIAFGYRRSEKLGFVGSVSWIDGDDTFGAPFEGSNVELDVFFFDFSFQFFPRGNRFYLLIGPGFADIEAEAELTVAGVPEQPSGTVTISESESTFTAHVGGGAEFDIGERAFFHGQTKIRWIDSDIYDDIDIEPTIGVGFRWGG